jgi:hypothetical protein
MNPYHILHENDPFDFWTWDVDLKEFQDLSVFVVKRAAAAVIEHTFILWTILKLNSDHIDFIRKYGEVE